MPEKKRLKRTKQDKREGKRAEKAGQRGDKSVSPTRSRAISGVLKREGRAAASKTALAKQARSAARRRTATDPSAAAKKAVRTKGPAERSAAARKAVRTRAQKCRHLGRS